MPALRDQELATPAVGPSDIDLDEESLSSSPPRLNVPPLKPAMPIAARDEEVDLEIPLAKPEERAEIFAPSTPAPRVEDRAAQQEADKDEPPTANRGRAALAAAGLRGPSDYPAWLRKILEGDGPAAVYIAGPDSAEIERAGKREPVTLSPTDAERLADNLRTLAARGTPRPAPDASVVNVTLPDGSRLVAVFPPAAAQVCAAIHRSAAVQKSLADLSADGALSGEMQQLLEACSTARRNVLVSGDRRAAETLLQALANTIVGRFRVVAIADRLAAPTGSAAAWIKLSAEPRNPEVMTAAIALRPDYLIVDVTAASTAADLLQECAVGQEGVFAAMAARSAGDALQRLQALAGSALGGSGNVRELIAGSFDLVAHASTLSDGSLRVLEIAEPRTGEDGRLVAEPLLAWRSDDGRNGTGHFQTTNAPSRLAATLAARGVQVPASVLQR
jgi:pilus assembly protein CpaF